MVYTSEFVSGIQAIPSPGQIMAKNARLTVLNLLAMNQSMITFGQDMKTKFRFSKKV